MGVETTGSRACEPSHWKEGTRRGLEANGSTERYLSTAWRNGAPRATLLRLRRGSSTGTNRHERAHGRLAQGGNEAYMPLSHQLHEDHPQSDSGVQLDASMKAARRLWWVRCVFNAAPRVKTPREPEKWPEEKNQTRAAAPARRCGGCVTSTRILTRISRSAGSSPTRSTTSGPRGAHFTLRNPTCPLLH